MNVYFANYLSGSLKIRRKDAVALYADHRPDLPGVSFFDALLLPGNMGELLLIRPFWWQGYGSGRAFEAMLPSVLRRTVGFAHLAFNWTDGTETRLAVANGEITDTVSLPSHERTGVSWLQR